MIIAALLFTLLEGSRYMMLGMMAVLNSQSVTESTLAEYNIPAYKNYHLFMLDSGFGTGELLLSKLNAQMQKLGQENLNPSVIGIGRYNNFLQMDVTDSSIIQYELATDHSARPLLRQISQLTKGEIAADLLEQAYKKATGIQDSYKQGQEADKYLDGALDTIKQANEAISSEANSSGTNLSGAGQFKVIQSRTSLAEASQSGRNPSGTIRLRTFLTETGQSETPVLHQTNVPFTQNDFPEITETPDAPVSNPIEDIKSAKSSPLLAQILPEGSEISAKQISKEDTVGTRTMNVGNYEQPPSSDIVEKMLIIQYLNKYTSHYQNQLQMPHALEYEQEYILFGKSTDEDNLKKMAGKLLLLREGINFAYLLTDSAKREEALAMATAIAAAAAIPAVITAIQMGLLASWAYAESIVELRTLFSGGSVAAIKSSGNWTVSLAEAVPVIFDTSIKSKEVSSGMDYKNYLQLFLTIESMENIGIRFSNLLEKNLRLYSGYEQVKLDCMITSMETENIYQAKQVFLSFVTIGRLSKKGYNYENKYKFGYSLDHSE